MPGIDLVGVSPSTKFRNYMNYEVPMDRYYYYYYYYYYYPPGSFPPLSTKCQKSGATVATTSQR